LTRSRRTLWSSSSAQLEDEHAGPLAVGQQHAEPLVLVEHDLELAHRR
jgi:hypothetical protein